MGKRQLVTPLDLVNALPDFEGLPVVQVGVEVPGIAGGLQDAMTVQPLVFHQGDRFALVIVGRVKKITHEAVEKDNLDGEQKRIHVMAVEEAGIVPVEAVDGLLVAQRDAIEAAIVEAEKAQGIHRLPTGEGDDEVEGDEENPEVVAGRIHNTGGHRDGLRDDCPLCSLEAEIAAEENGTTLEEEFERRRAHDA